MITTLARSPLPSRPAALRAAALAAVLQLLVARGARAENSVTYKFQDYRESGGRVTVHAHAALIEQDLGTDLHVKLQGVIDAIAGATPNGSPPEAPGEPVPLTHLSDRRKAWSAEGTRQFSRGSVTLGVASSRESDYVSRGWSVNTLTDFNRKNTSLLLGLAGTDDDVAVRFLGANEKKRGLDAIVGITQLLDARTSVALNVGYGRSTGYLGDPYRLVYQEVEVLPGIILPLTFPENRPPARDKWTVHVAFNHAFPELRGAIDASYRYYRDTFGTRAHTVSLEWIQRLGDHLVLRPGLRFYDQSQADFYYPTLSGTTITPTYMPGSTGVFYSSDYRLSAFRSTTVGVKAAWNFNAHWSLEAATEVYAMKGRDRVTSPTAYPRATINTLGVRFAW